MPDNPLSSLYPPAPQQQPQGLLSGDPAKVIDLARGVGALSLLPLQREQLQTQIAGGQISNITAQQVQDAQRMAIIANSYSAIDPKTATADTIHSHTTTMARLLTRQGLPTAGLIAAQEHVLSDPQGIPHGIGSMLNLARGAAGVTAAGPEVLGPGGEKKTPSAGEYTYLAGGGDVTTAAPPGVLEDYRAEQVRANTYPDRINPLRQSIPILERMTPEQIGPTSEEFNHIKSAVQTLGLGKIAGIDPNKIADYNELKKYMAAYSSQRAQGLGPHTNEGLATAVTSNPNPKLDLLSARQLSKMNLGMERMRQALFREFQGEVKAGRVQAWKFNEWMPEHAQDLDPSAFVYDLLDARSQKFVSDRLKTRTQEEKWQASHDLAKKWGLLGDVSP